VFEATKLDRNAVTKAGRATFNPQSFIPHPTTPRPSPVPRRRLRRRSSRPNRQTPRDPHTGDPHTGDPHASAPKVADAKYGEPGTVPDTAEPQLVHPCPCTTIGTGSADTSKAELSNNRDAFMRKPPIP